MMRSNLVFLFRGAITYFYFKLALIIPLEQCFAIFFRQWTLIPKNSHFKILQYNGPLLFLLS